MNKSVKVLVTVGIIVVYLISSFVLLALREDAGHKTPGFIGIILLLGVYGAVRAIWKSPKKKNNDNNNDSSILQK